MTEYDLVPGGMYINYHSDFGRHIATFPTKEWNPTPLVPGNVMGSFTNWLDLPCDGEEMLDDLIDALRPFYNASVTFDTVTVFTKADVDSPTIPRAGKAIGLAGTNTTGNWYKAAQHNWLFRDTAFKLSKITLLDCPIGAGWDPTSILPGSGPIADLVGAWTSTSWAWSSRANNRPATFSKITYTLNQKLRQEYGMD